MLTCIYSNLQGLVRCSVQYWYTRAPHKIEYSGIPERLLTPDTVSGLRATERRRRETRQQASGGAPVYPCTLFVFHLYFRTNTAWWPKPEDIPHFEDTFPLSFHYLSVHLVQVRGSAISRRHCAAGADACTGMCAAGLGWVGWVGGQSGVCPPGGTHWTVRARSGGAALFVRGSMLTADGCWGTHWTVPGRGCSKDRQKEIIRGE